MKNLMTRLFKEEEGQGMVEYSLLIAAIAIVLFVGYKAFGKKLEVELAKLYNSIKDGVATDSIIEQNDKVNWP